MRGCVDSTRQATEKADATPVSWFNWHRLLRGRRLSIRLASTKALKHRRQNDVRVMVDRHLALIGHINTRVCTSSAAVTDDTKDREQLASLNGGMSEDIPRRPTALGTNSISFLPWSSCPLPTLERLSSLVRSRMVVIPILGHMLQVAGSCLLSSDIVTRIHTTYPSITTRLGAAAPPIRA